MCGITAFFARESRIDYKHLDTLFSATENRGKDGFGLYVIKRDPSPSYACFKNHKPYSECKDEVEKFVRSTCMSIGDLVIAISRAAPETEGNTDENRLEETMQPIISHDDGLIVVHNGAVSNKIYLELRKWAEETGKYKFKTDIDSEAIIASYLKHERNMKDCMEYLSGGFSCIMYDLSKDCLYVMNDHMQISHGYLRGIGFFLHSENDAIGKVIQDVTGCTKDGICAWENFYHHFLDGHAIRCMDLQSGMMVKTKFRCIDELDVSVRASGRFGE